MVIAVVNNFTTPPLVWKVYDRNGLENGTASYANDSVYEQYYGNEMNNWTNHGPAITLLNGDRLFMYIGISIYNGWQLNPTMTMQHRLYNVTNSVVASVSPMQDGMQYEYFNNTGGTISIQLQAYGSGNAGNYWRIFKYGWNIVSSVEFAKWEQITTGSLTARHRKQYIENIYLFCPRNGTNVTLDGLTLTHSVNQTIKVIPVNTVSTRLDYQGTGTIFTALTGKGFNVSV